MDAYLPLQILSAGSNAQGQLGHGNLDDSYTFQPCLFSSSSELQSDSELPGKARVVSIKCGANHTVLLLERRDQSTDTTFTVPVRELWGCGDGRKGQLGPAMSRRNSPESTPTKLGGSDVFRRIDEDIMIAASIDPYEYIISDVECAWESTFVAFRPRSSDSLPHSKDTIISMGNNDHGDLGVDLAPAELPFSDKPLPVSLENIFSTCPGTVLGFRLLDLISGQHHVIATFRVFHENSQATNVIVGWGACRHGQLGDNVQPPPLATNTGKRQQKKIPSPNGVVSFISRPCLLALPLDFAVSDLASRPIGLGNQHTVLLHRSGTVTGLGSNRKNQTTGLNTLSGVVTAVHCTWNGTYLYQEIDDGEWRIYSTGSGDKGQLGHHHSDRLTLAPVDFPFKPFTYKLVNVACGSEHVVVLLEKSQPEGGTFEVWGWGWNEHGNLGLGHTADVPLPSLLWPPSQHESAYCGRPMAISAGCGTTWIVLGSD